MYLIIVVVKVKLYITEAFIFNTEQCNESPNIALEVSCIIYNHYTIIMHIYLYKNQYMKDYFI